MPTTDANDIDRNAYNAAFFELGLRWYWDGPTWSALAAEPCERTRLRRYLEGSQPHLLRAYDAEFLTDTILATQQRCRESLRRSPCATMGSGCSRFAEIGA